MSRLLAVCLGFGLAFSASAGELARKEVPPLEAGSAGTAVVVIPADWRTYSPFAERFAVSESARVIDLAAGRFATSELAIGQAPELAAFSAELVRTPFPTGTLREHLIVQARGPAEQAELRKELEAAGTTILGYLPEFAYLVRADRPESAALAKSEHVVWLGLYQPAFRIEPKLEWVAIAAPQQPLTLQVAFDAELAEDAALDAALASVGGKVLLLEKDDAGWLARVAAPAAAARSLARLPGALWVERFAEFETFNNVARTSAATPTARGAASGPILDVEDVWSRGLRGEGQIAAAADTGLSTGNVNTLHWDFGQAGSPTNPSRLVSAYALARPGDWSDNQSFGGGHGTHVSGSIVGNGVRSGANPATNTFPATSYAGTAPKSGFVFQSIMNSTGLLTGIPANLNNLFQPPYNDGARVHSNSWGSAQRGVYTTNAQQVDQFTWNNKDMVILFAMGNDGVDGRRVVNSVCTVQGEPQDGVIDQDSTASPATAKNALSIGATENYRPDFVYEFPQGDCTSVNGVEQKTWGWFSACRFGLNPINGDLMADNANGMGAFSSRGWTDDLRIKPELVAPGIAIVSTRTDLNQAYQQWGTCNVPAALQPFYITQGGTSMATPLTAGAATLVRQYYAEGWHPNHGLVTHGTPDPGVAFNPTAALVKATLVNGAWDMRPGQYGSGGATQEMPAFWDTGRDLPNNTEGFGRVDLEASLFPGSGFGNHPSRDLEVHDETVGLTTGMSTTYGFTVASSADELTATLAWTDPWAATGAGIKLINDLDLTLTDPNGVVWGPNGVDRVNPLPDRRNNLEQARITAPAPGVWSATVTAFNVPGNGAAGTNSQPFALVLSGLLNLCGNHAIETPEICDGTALAGQSCVSQGFDGGALACSASCDAFDTSACVTCTQGTTSGAWNLPSGATNGVVEGYIYVGTGTTVLYKLVLTLVETTPGNGTFSGTLYDGNAPDPDYTTTGTFTSTSAGLGTWTGLIFDPLGTQVGKLGGTFRDNPSPAIRGTFKGDWKICE